MRYNDILGAVGSTPLVRLNRLVPSESAAVYVKLESANPCGSVKDRIAVAMIEAAEKDGSLKPGMTIVEPTSGNTGIGLAMVAAAKGYRCVLVMPETMSKERRGLLKMLGADLVLTPGPEGMKGAIAKAAELVKRGGCFQPFQFSNPANPGIHGRTTAAEIIQDMGNLHLDVFVSGIGTGGTISGTGKVLKERFGCKVVGVEPEASPVISGGEPGPHVIQGIGAGFIPDNYHADVVDEIVTVANEDALQTARELARQEGILAGISAGANVFVALRQARGLQKCHSVATLICDTGERYLSTALFEEPAQ